MTYREILRLTGKSERRGGYGRSWRGVSRALRDLWTASKRWALMVAILGYGQPRIVE